MITEADHKTAERLKSMMIEQGLPIEKVIVFGSRARGDAEEDSDLDLFVVVSQRNRPIKEAIDKCCWQVGFEEGIIIQTVVMTRDEADNSPQRSSLLMQASRQEGVAI